MHVILFQANNIPLMSQRITAPVQVWGTFHCENVYNLNMFLCETILLPVVLYGYETWSLPLREECRLRVLEIRILRQIFMSKRNIIKSGEGSTMRNFIVCIVHLI